MVDTVTTNLGLVKPEIGVAGTSNWAGKINANYDTIDGLLASAFNRRRNRNYDPGMRVSQEKGNTSTTLPVGRTYISDSLVAEKAGTVVAATGQRVTSFTPGGSGFRNRVTITTAAGSLAAGEFLVLRTPIEGIEIADLRWGTTGAKSTLYRFGFRSPISGVFPVSVSNGGAAEANSTRTWLGTISVAPGEVNTDLVRYVVVPGDATVSGVWDTGFAVGMVLSVGIYAGSTYQGAAGWQTGVYYTLAGAVNGAATAGLAFDIFDVGTYDVSDITNPVPPRFELKSFGDDLRDCYRYYYYESDMFEYFVQFGNAAYSQWSRTWPVKMRLNPLVNYTVGLGSGNWNSNFPQIQKANISVVVLRGDITPSSGFGYVTSVTAGARMI